MISPLQGRRHGRDRLPKPANFSAATQTVNEDDLAGLVPCGPSVEGIARGVKRFTNAGFERVALVQIGDRQEGFCGLYERRAGRGPTKALRRALSHP